MAHERLKQKGFSAGVGLLGYRDGDFRLRGGPARGSLIPDGHPLGPDPVVPKNGAACSALLSSLANWGKGGSPHDRPSTSFFFLYRSSFFFLVGEKAADDGGLTSCRGYVYRWTPRCYWHIWCLARLGALGAYATPHWPPLGR